VAPLEAPEQLEEDRPIPKHETPNDLMIKPTDFFLLRAEKI
jgi:hypothetical protein